MNRTSGSSPRRTARRRGPRPSKPPRRWRWAVPVFLGGLVACAVIGTEERPAPGGLYREAVVGQPLSLNPLLHPSDPIARDVSHLIHAGLVRVSDGGRIEPGLAQSWTTENEGRTYTFRLHPAARWHDERAVTSADVRSTVALLQSPAYRGPRELAAVWRQVRVEAPDPLTVRFHLTEPYASFIEACSLPLLPAHIFDGAATLADHPGSYSPVGAGPFRVEAIDPEGIRMVRHDGYPGQRPLLDEVQLRFYPDLSSAVAGLIDGEVDGVAGLSRQDASRLPNAGEWLIREEPLLGHQTMLLMNHAHPILQDRAVRQAIALGITRGPLIAGSLAAEAVAAYGPIPSYSWAYRSDVEVEADALGAARLLGAAGWTGGPVRSRNGRPLRLQLIAPADETQTSLAEGLASQLASIGVGVQVQPVEPLDLYRERLLPRSYDLALVGMWLGTVDPDPYRLWHSSQRGDGFNFAAYANPAADELLARARADGDPTRRLQALSAFQRLWVDDVPSVVLASPLLRYAISTQVRGVQLGVVPEPGARFQHIAEWHLRTQRVLALPRL